MKIEYQTGGNELLEPQKEISEQFRYSTTRHWIHRPVHPPRYIGILREWGRPARVPRVESKAWSRTDGKRGRWSGLSKKPRCHHLVPSRFLCNSQFMNFEKHNSGMMIITCQELWKSKCNNTDYSNTKIIILILSFLPAHFRICRRQKDWGYLGKQTRSHHIEGASFVWLSTRSWHSI